MSVIVTLRFFIIIYSQVNITKNLQGMKQDGGFQEALPACAGLVEELSAAATCTEQYLQQYGFCPLAVPKKQSFPGKNLQL